MSDFKMSVKEAMDNLWLRIKPWLSGLDTRVTTQEQAGYITQETDPTVPSWAKQSTKPTYTPDEIGALAKSAENESYITGSYLRIHPNDNTSGQLRFGRNDKYDQSSMNHYHGSTHFGVISVAYPVTNEQYGTTVTKTCLRFDLYNSNNYFDRYELPQTEQSQAENKIYAILTTKNLVAVSQGGTGADNATQARLNLGIIPMTGATSGAAGAAGLVPAPASGDHEKYLRGDGTWAVPSGGGDDLGFYIDQQGYICQRIGSDT